MAYVYRHIRVDNGKTFYIGVGGTSSFDNYKRAYNNVSRSEWWKRVANKAKYTVEIMFDNISVEEALRKENELIIFYGRKDLGEGSLVNLTDGGDGNRGYKMKESTKQKLSKLKKGKPLPINTISKAWEKNRGRKRTKEEIRKLSKIVIDINTGVFYYGTKEVANLYGYNLGTLRSYLSGVTPNLTQFRYAEEDGIKQVVTTPNKNIKRKGDNPSSKLVLDLQTGIYYDCVKDACEAKEQSEHKVYQQLRGKNRNTVYLTYV